MDTPLNSRDLADEEAWERHRCQQMNWQVYIQIATGTIMDAMLEVDPQEHYAKYVCNVNTWAGF
jgi:hypothetical protein